MPANPYTLGIGLSVDQANVKDALGQLQSTVSGFVDFFTEGVSFLKPAEEFEHATHQMAVAMGGTAAEATVMRDQIFDLAETTGYSLSEVGELSRGLSQAGATLGDFGESTQLAMNVWSSSFGAAGEEMVKSEKTLRSFGGSTGELLGQATQFTKQFNMPGVFQELPWILDEARTATLTFSKSVVGTGKQVIAATLNVGGAFAKAFGLTAADAMGRASSALQKLRGAAQKDADVFLGLGTEFSGLSMSIMQTGTGLYDAMEIVRGAGQGDLGSLEQLASIRDRMPDGIMKDRFMRQLQQELPEDMLALVSDTERLHKALADQQAAEDLKNSIGGQGVLAFNALGDEMRDTALGAREMFKNVIDLGKAVFTETGALDIMKGALKSARDTFADWTGRIGDFIKSDSFKERVAEWKPMLERVASVALKAGAIFVGLGSAVGGLASSFLALKGGSMIGGRLLQGFAKLIPGLGGPLSSVTGAFGSLGGTLMRLLGKAGPIGLFYGAFQGIKTAVLEAGEILGNPSATGMEKFEALTRGVFKGVGEFVDTILLGIPSKIASVLFPDMEDQFDSGISGIFSWLKSKFSGGVGFGSMIAGWLESASGAFHTWMKGIGPAIKEFGKGLGGMIGGLARGVVEFLGEGVKTYWNNLKWYDIFLGPFGAILPWFRAFGTDAGGDLTDGLGSGFASIFGVLQDIGDGILTFLASVTDGFLGAFGSSLGEAKIVFQMFGEQMLHYGTIAWNGLTRGFGSIWDIVGLYISEFVEETKVSFTKWLGAARLVGAAISAAFSGDFSGIQIAGLNVFRSLTNAAFDMATEVMSNIAMMFRPLAKLGIPGMEAIVGGMESAIESVKDLQSSADAGFATMIDNAEKAAKGTGDRMAAIRQETANEVASIQQTAHMDRQAILDRQAARDEASRLEDSEHKNRMDRLSEQLAAEMDATERRQAQEMEAGRFKKAAKTQLEQALQSIDAVEGVTKASKREATSALRSYMSEQTSAIADEVAKGVLTQEQAAARLQAAAARATEEAKKSLQQKAAGDVAESANGAAQTVAGLNPAAMRQLFANVRGDILKDKQQGAQRVQVDLRGGDGVSRELVRGAAVRNLNVTGGGG